MPKHCDYSLANTMRKRAKSRTEWSVPRPEGREREARLTAYWAKREKGLYANATEAARVAQRPSRKPVTLAKVSMLDPVSK